MLAIRALTSHPQACYGRYPSRSALGAIFPSILSPAYLHLMAIQVILVVVDRFSKAAHFVALPKLPSAAETAQLLVDHVFKLHSLPQDVVSDRGPQFKVRFWRAFCSLLGASAMHYCRAN